MIAHRSRGQETIDATMASAQAPPIQSKSVTMNQPATSALDAPLRAPSPTPPRLDALLECAGHAARPIARPIGGNLRSSWTGRAPAMKRAVLVKVGLALPLHPREIDPLAGSNSTGADTLTGNDHSAGWSLGVQQAIDLAAPERLHCLGDP